jgi:hypothetical protein
MRRSISEVEGPNRRRLIGGPLLVGVALVLAAAAPAEAVRRRAFVTSVSGTGNISTWPDAEGLHGLAGADQICRVRAAAGGLPNAVTYRAWMSTAGTDAYCHVRGQSGKKSTGCTGTAVAAGPWYQVNGTTFWAGSLAELTGAERKIVRPVLYDEFGDLLSGADSRYWTGTRADGTAAIATCSSWVTASASVEGWFGVGPATAIQWTDFTDQVCNAQYRLLCLEPGASDPPSPVGWSPAALVFVTSEVGNSDLGSWPEAPGAAVGIAAGDEICRNLAAVSGVPAPESFVAWLSDGTTDARDRLTLTNAVYRRLDGYAVAANRADLIDGANTNSIHLDETGTYLNANTLVHTATDGDGTGNEDHCDGWTSASSSVFHRGGNASWTRDDGWTDNSSGYCHLTSRLYCFSNVVTLFWDGFEQTGDTSRWSVTQP